MTFIYDDSFSASYTLKKLIEAQKRGVKVCLMIDDANNRANKSLKKELMAKGGLVHSLNPIIPYFTSLKLSRDVFRRHHEKVFVADDIAIVGSANIADDYSGPIYGSYEYIDLNLVMKNLCLSEVRGFFKEIADHYQYPLDPEISNTEVIKKYDELFRESIFNIPKLRVIKTHPPHIEEIQEFIINNMEHAKESIKIIQPYYIPIRRFETVLVKALERGVKVELITAGRRHTSVYTSIKNSIMFNTLLKSGLKVYEIPDKLLHMKVYQFDNKSYTAGSFNNDRWSWDIDNELNIVAEGKEEIDHIEDVFQAIKTIAKPLDPDMSIGFTRFAKIKFWENFLLVSEWLSNKKRAYKAEKTMKEHKELLHALEINDLETVEKIKKKRVKIVDRILDVQPEV